MESSSRPNSHTRRVSVRSLLQNVTNMKTPKTDVLNTRLSGFRQELGRHYDDVSNNFDRLTPSFLSSERETPTFKQFKKKLSLVLDKIDENKRINKFLKDDLRSITEAGHSEIGQRINNKYGSTPTPSIIDFLLDDNVKAKTLKRSLGFEYPGKSGRRPEDLQKALDRLIRYNMIKPTSTLDPTSKLAHIDRYSLDHDLYTRQSLERESFFADSSHSSEVASRGSGLSSLQEFLHN